MPKLFAILAAMAMFGLVACESERPATRAGAAVDRAGTATGNAVDRAAAATGGALERSGTYVKEKATGQ